MYQRQKIFSQEVFRIAVGKLKEVLLRQKVFSQEDFRTAVGKLKEVHLLGFDDYDASHFLYRTILDYMLVGTCSHITGRELRRRDYSISVSKRNAKHRIVLYKAPKYNFRKDMTEALEKVAQCSDDICIMKEHCTNTPDWALLVRIPFLLQWFFALRKNGFSGLLLFALLADAFKTLRFLLDIRRNQTVLNTSDAFVVLNDENCDENIFVQYGQKQDIPTAALQHGHYARTVDDNDISHFMHVLENLTADRIFMWGDYYKKLAVACGVSPERVVSVGIPKYVGIPAPDQHKEFGVFGLFLDASVTQRTIDSNFKLIQICNRFARENGYRYLVKTHPGDSVDRYKEYYDSNVYFSTEEKDKKILDVVKKIDFSVSGMSSVYIEMFYCKLPMFRYYDLEQDVFEWIDFGKFTNYEEFAGLYHEMKANPEAYIQELLRVRDYCCGKGNTGDNYRKAMESLVALRRETNAG